MKRIAALLLAAASLTAAAQQAPPTPPQTPAQAEIQKQAQLLQSQAELLYNKLRDITEFKQYVQVEQQLNDLPRQYAAAAAPAQPTPKPPVSTPKPPTPRK